MSERIVKLDPPDSISAMGPKRKTERASLDFEAWRAHLAAPGSKFKSTRPQPPRIVHLDTVLRPADAAELERRTA
jgi:hypothetical protein